MSIALGDFAQSVKREEKRRFLRENGKKMEPGEEVKSVGDYEQRRSGRAARGKLASSDVAILVA